MKFTNLPYRLGTTSFIYRDHILPNVDSLKEKVDSIELLVFETDEQSNYPSDDEIRALNDISLNYNLAFTVHLPIRVPLGTRNETVRSKNVSAILRAVDATRALHPHAWDLHLEPDEESRINPIHNISAWQEACIQSLEELKTHGVDPEAVGIETLEYPFEYVEPVLEKTGFGICLDIGHCWYRNFDEDYFIDKLLPRARSFHIHGFDKTRDHKSLELVPKEKIQRFFNALAALPDPEDRCVSLEIFSEKDLEASLKILQNLEIV